MDFHRFAEESWSQVGIKNRLKIDAKKHPKNNGKQEASWRRLGRILGSRRCPGEGGPLQRQAGFRSLNEKFEREEGRYRR